MSFFVHRRKPGSVLKTMRSFDFKKHQPATYCRLIKESFPQEFFSPSSISFNDNVIVRNFTLRSFSNICHQLETFVVFLQNFKRWREEGDSRVISFPRIQSPVQSPVDILGYPRNRQDKATGRQDDTISRQDDILNRHRVLFDPETAS